MIAYKNMKRLFLLAVSLAFVSLGMAQTIDISTKGTPFTHY